MKVMNLINELGLGLNATNLLTFYVEKYNQQYSLIAVEDKNDFSIYVLKINKDDLGEYILVEIVSDTEKNEINKLALNIIGGD